MRWVRRCTVGFVVFALAWLCYSDIRQQRLIGERLERIEKRLYHMDDTCDAAAHDAFEAKQNSEECVRRLDDSVEPQLSEINGAVDSIKVDTDSIFDLVNR